MFHLIVPTFALALPIGVPGGNEEAPSVLRVYDVSAAAPVVGSQDGSAIPALRTRLDVSGRISRAVRGKEVCLEVLHNLQTDQWEVAGRALELDEAGRLQVLAPPALQANVVATLDFLADTFGRESRLVVDLVTLKTGEADALPALVPVAEIGRHVEAASTHQSYEIGALAGERGWSQAVRTLEVVDRYEVQIAQTAVSFQAVLEHAAVGLAIESVLTPAPGGWWLALNVQDARQAGELQEVELLQESRITTDSSIVSTRGPSRYQPLHIDVMTCAINAWLPEGKALVVRAATESGRGTTRVLFVRPQGAPTGAITRMPADLERASGGQSAAFIRTDAYALPEARIEASEGTTRLRSMSAYGEPEEDADRYATPQLEFRAADALVGRLSDADVSLMTEGVWAVAVGPDRAGVDALLAQVSPLLPEPRALGVTLTLRRGPSANAPLASAAFALRAGARSTIVLGQESTLLRSTRTEVAQGASVVFPQVSSAFEGIAVSIDPRTTTSGGLHMSVEAHARAVRGATRAFQPSTSIPPVQEQDADLLDVERDITFAKSESGPKRIVLGNAGSSTEALTLEIEVVDLR